MIFVNVMKVIQRKINSSKHLRSHKKYLVSFITDSDADNFLSEFLKEIFFIGTRFRIYANISDNQTKLILLFRTLHWILEDDINVFIKRWVESA